MLNARIANAEIASQQGRQSAVVTEHRRAVHAALALTKRRIKHAECTLVGIVQNID
jgi:hypothetical protein